MKEPGSNFYFWKWYYANMPMPRFYTKEQACDFLLDMNKIIAEYGAITVGDTIDMLHDSKSAEEPSIYEYGWTNLAYAKVVKGPSGPDNWYLELPDPIYISQKEIKKAKRKLLAAINWDTVKKVIKNGEHALAVIGGVTLLAIITGKVQPVVGVSFKVN